MSAEDASDKDDKGGTEGGKKGSCQSSRPNLAGERRRPAPALTKVSREGEQGCWQGDRSPRAWA